MTLLIAILLVKGFGLSGIFWYPLCFLVWVIHLMVHSAPSTKEAKK